jgi:hypothetical protein
MRAGYLDTSCLVAVALEEPEAGPVRAALASLDRVYSSHLLEAEFLSAMEREGVRDGARGLLEQLKLVHPDGRLTRWLDEILDLGYVRGADLHHLAVACHLFKDPARVLFMTLDSRQDELAEGMGFLTLGAR